MKRLKFLFKVEILVIIVLILSTILLFMRLDFNKERVFEINTTLMTVSGIFSAIILSFLLTRINRLIDQRLILKNEIEVLSTKLTNFRRLLYYVLRSDELWGKDNSYFLQILRLYPLIHINTPPDKRYGRSIIDRCIENERFEYKKTKFFLSMLSIVDTKSYEELKLIAPATKYKYTLKQLNYYSEPCNNLWYLKPSSIKSDSPIVGAIYKDSLIDVYEKLIGSKPKDENLNISLLSNLGSEFHSKIIPEMYDKIEFLSKSIPLNLRILFFELIVMLVTGLLFPLIIISTRLISSLYFTKISLIATISVLIIFLVTFFKHINDDVKVY